jgi:hypothetical protein
MPLFRPSLPENAQHFGVLGQFAGPRDLYQACEKVRDAGFSRWDAHTPFPVHGLERAMGLRPSLIPWLVLILGLTFAAGAMVLQWWTSAVDYKLVISGKPLFSWPAFVPITFELGVLGGAVAAFFGMLALNQLPTLHHPLFGKKIFERVTDDGFFISIEAWDPKFDAEDNARFLDAIGAVRVELVENTVGGAPGESGA